MRKTASGDDRGKERGDKSGKEKISGILDNVRCEKRHRTLRDVFNYFSKLFHSLYTFKMQRYGEVVGLKNSELFLSSTNLLISMQ